MKRWDSIKAGVRDQLHIMARNKAAYGLMAPFLILFFIFTVLPVLTSAAYSFTYYNGFSSPEWAGVKNYINLLVQDNVFVTAFQNTVVLALITGPLSYLLCFGFAWVINEFSPRLRAIMTLLFYAPSISGQVFLIWQLLFSGDFYGMINATLYRFGMINAPIQWLTDTRYMLMVVVIVQLWLSLGTGFLAFIAGFQGVDRSLYEAAAVDGVKNRFQEVWYITLPSMRPILLFGAVMQIAASFSISQVPMLLTGFPSTDYATHTILIHLLDYGTIRFDVGYASAIAVILFLLMVGTNKLIQRLLKTVGK